MKCILVFILFIYLKGHTQTVEYKYDSLNRIVKVIYEDNAVIEYSYDANGNKITQNTTSLKCSLNERFFYADTTNANIVSYKWEVNTGSGFSDIIENDHYNGVNTARLHLINVSSDWYGYQYRCLVTYNDNSTSYNPWFSLVFALHWKGSVSDAWENPLNWSCGVIPDENTDVIIDSGTLHNPVVYTGGKCRSLNSSLGTSVLVKENVELKITGK